MIDIEDVEMFGKEAEAVCDDLYVVEWSEGHHRDKRCAFHVEPLERALRSNVRMMLTHRDPSVAWIPVFVGTQEECFLCAEAIDRAMRNRTGDGSDV